MALFKMQDGSRGTPNDSTPTTHILKPSIPLYTEHHINEFMTMAAAEHLGMNLAQDEVISNAFYQSLVFNVAMQGTDAHAKNCSLLLDEGDVRLAPLYDLGSHAPTPSVNGSPLYLAMSVDGEYRIDAVGVDELLRAGSALGLDPDESRAIATSYFTHTPDAFAAATDSARQLPGLADRRSRELVSLLVDKVAEYAKREAGWSANGTWRFREVLFRVDDRFRRDEHPSHHPGPHQAQRHRQ